MNLLKLTQRYSMTMTAMVVVCSITLMSGCAGMQKTPEKAVAEPGKFPAEGKQAGNMALQGVIAEGVEGILKLTDNLVPPGTGDDTQERYAVHGLAIMANAPGAGDLQAVVNKAMTQALKKEKDKQVKAFLIEQIQISGDENVVDALADYLTDEDLCLKATQALLVIDSDKVVKAFRAALPKMEGRNLVSIINALGALKDKESAKSITKLVNSEDRDIRMAANYALASIGDPKSKDALLEATETKDDYDRAKALRYYILYAQSLAGRGEKDEAIHLCREVLQDGKRFPNNTQCGALHTLSEILGVEVIEDLLLAMANEDLRVRSKAMELALDYSDNAITRDIVAYYHRKAAPEIQAEILRFFARKGDLKVLPTVFDALDSDEQVVRLAAIESVAKLAGDGSVNALLDVMGTDNEDELAAIEAALTEVPGDVATASIAAGLKDSDPQVQATTLDILKARKASGELPQIVALGGDNSQTVRLAALGALETLATEENIPKLVRYLLDSVQSKELKAAEKALNSTVERAGDKEGAAVSIIFGLEATEDVDKKVALIGALRRTGTDEAMGKVKKLLKSDDDELVDASVRALADWPNAKPIEVLPRIIKESDNQVYQVLALRGLVRQIGLASDLDAKEQLGLYQKAMKMTDRPDEKKKIVSAMADLKTLDALAAVAGYIGEKDLNDEAIAAAMKVLPNVYYANPEETKKVSAKIRKNTDSEKVLKKLEETEKVIEEYEGYIVHWELAGPYTQEGIEGPEGVFDIAFAPEQKKADVEWKKITTDIPDRPYLVDFNKIIRKNHAAAYVRTVITSPERRQVVLELGSDDGAKAWLNGKVVSKNNAPRGFNPGEDKATLNLKKGENILMIKVTQGGGDWSLGARIRSTDGGPVEGLTYMQ